MPSAPKVLGIIDLWLKKDNLYGPTLPLDSSGLINVAFVGLKTAFCSNFALKLNLKEVQDVAVKDINRELKLFNKLKPALLVVKQLLFWALNPVNSTCGLNRMPLALLVACTGMAAPKLSLQAFVTLHESATEACAENGVCVDAQPPVPDANTFGKSTVKFIVSCLPGCVQPLSVTFIDMVAN